MGGFEHRAIKTAVSPNRIWKRCVDDTFVIQHQLNREHFLKHINSVNPSIQFTVEETRADGSTPFHDTIIITQTDVIFKTEL